MKYAKLPLCMASVLVWAITTPAQAQVQPNENGRIDPAIAEAVARDLGLSLPQARDRMRAERAVAGRRPMLQEALGDTFGGAWFDPAELDLVVATTDPQETDRIARSGARPMVVERSMRDLEDIHRQLDQGVLQLSSEQRQSIWAWGIDVRTNTVRITIPANDPRALLTAQDLVTLSGVDPNTVRVEQSTDGPPSLFQSYVVRGGDKYTNTTDSSVCSVGFSVPGGYVTAGHCSGGTIGDNVIGYNGVSQGTFLGSVYPGADSAWVGVNGDWTPRPCVGTGSDRDCAARSGD